MQISTSVLNTLMGVDRCVQIQLVVIHALAVLAIVSQMTVVDVMVSDYPRFELLVYTVLFSDFYFRY